MHCNLSLEQYLDLYLAIDENPTSHKDDVANGINMRKAFLTTSSYSYFMLFQNSNNDNEASN